MKPVYLYVYVQVLLVLPIAWSMAMVLGVEPHKQGTFTCQIHTYFHSRVTSREVYAQFETQIH